jgi:DNA ligase 1
MTIKTHRKLYKKDSNENTRVWWQESDGDKFRTNSGVVDGEIVVSEWSVCTPKNVGKANATTGESQCLLEVEANYKKKLAQGNYKETIDEESLSKDNYIKPMLAKKYLEDYTPSKDDYKNGIIYSSYKLDGTRCVASKDGLMSRQGKQILSTPHVFEAFKPLFEKHPELVLDGELYTDKLADNFNEIISLVRRIKPTAQELEDCRKLIQFHVYDVATIPDSLIASFPALSFKANTKQHYSFAQRYEVLQHIVKQVADSNEYVVLVEAIKVKDEAQLDELFQTCLERGYEGQMIRLSKAPYEFKRSKQLLKRKEFEEEEFLITDIVEGIGNRSGMAGNIVCKTKSNTEFGAGIRGDRDFFRDLLANKDSYVGTLASIRFQNLTPDGVPRFPVAVKFWGNKERNY